MVPLLHAIKELALVLRTRLEDMAIRGEAVDRPCLEALIVLQKTVEEAESGARVVPTRILTTLSTILLETPLLSPAGELLEQFRDACEQCEGHSPEPRPLPHEESD